MKGNGGLILTEEKNKFVLYEYLLYFLRKKKYFIIIPLLTTLLVAGLVYALKSNDKFTGEALVFTGSVKNDDLVHPNNLEAEFSDVNPTVKVFVTERHQVKISLKGNSKTEAKNDINKIVSLYKAQLSEQADSQVERTENRIAVLEELVAVRKEALELYNSKLQASLPPEQYDEIRELIIKTEETMTEADETAYKMGSDLLFFEEPEILSQEVSKPKTYLPESIFAGIILGLMLTFVFLILLKYIEDARRFYKHG
jgi:hypothetical protein